MNSKDILQLVSKSLGIYVFVLAILSVKHIVLSVLMVGVTSSTGTSMGFFVVQFLDTPIQLAISWFLIFKSERVAARLGLSEEKILAIPLSKADVMEIVFVAIGLFMVAQALAEILDSLASYVYFNEFNRNERDEFWAIGQRKGNLIYYCLKLVIGIGVMTKGKLLASRI